ncbi:MAG TPA: GNAT family N-acetyltransferase [Acidobacteriota bacterium]|nr:GNAT family N-acetyltransferase [Acidobacteriota bacterium]
MVAYRFCRPDDASRIVDAIRTCFDVHFPEAETSLEQFQREVREIDLWPSNCMLATEGGEPIAVCTAAKRPREVLVQRIGVRPDCQRQGHGTHLLTSLRKKLQVLGPSRLIAEVPEDRRDLARFFLRQGWKVEERYTDFWLRESLSGLKNNGAMVPVTVSDLIQSGLLADPPFFPWERQLRTLQQRADQIEGWAIASLEQIEGCILFQDRTQPACRMLLRLAIRETAPEPALIAELLLRMASAGEVPVLFPRVSEGEAISQWLQEAGFRAGERWVRFAIFGPEFDRD